MLTSLPAWPQIVLYPPAAALALWAGLTLLVGGLNRRGPGPGRVALLAGLPLLALAHHELVAVAQDGSVAGAYRGFIAGSLIWAWHELAFYCGALAGPWRRPCPPEARGAARLGYALGTHLYHELAMLAEAALLLGLLRDGQNMVGPMVIALSWAMQHSAKLNVLLGVRCLDVAMFPPHLRYLGSFWRRGAPGAFFIPSTSALTLLAAMLWLAANAHSLAPTGVRLALLASLVSLGALEHWLLALPQRQPRPAPAPQPE